MRIESFIHGRSIGTESAYDAFTTYLAVICKEEGITEMHDVMPKLVKENLGMFLSCLIDNGQIHVSNLQGEKLLDQFIVHDMDYDSFQFV